VKLLLDQNLSHRLIEALSDLYPGSAHVRDLGLQRADDAAVWQIASTRGLIVVTKDSDFRQRSFLLGAPPKIALSDGRFQSLWRASREGFRNGLQFRSKVSVARPVRARTSLSHTWRRIREASIFFPPSAGQLDLVPSSRPSPQLQMGGGVSEEPGLPMRASEGGPIG
jgi:hypothetical protein